MTPLISASPTVQQRCAAAELEFSRIELRRVGVRRALLERDRQSVLLVELLRLDDGGQERAERRRPEYDDGKFLQFVGRTTLPSSPTATRPNPRQPASLHSLPASSSTALHAAPVLFLAALNNATRHSARGSADRRLKFLSQGDEEASDQMLRNAGQNALSGHRPRDRRSRRRPCRPGESCSRHRARSRTGPVPLPWPSVPAPDTLMLPDLRGAPCPTAQSRLRTSRPTAATLSCISTL